MRAPNLLPDLSGIVGLGKKRGVELDTALPLATGLGGGSSGSVSILLSGGLSRGSGGTLSSWLSDDFGLNLLRGLLDGGNDREINRVHHLLIGVAHLV